MKIIVMDIANLRIEILNVADHMIENDDIEKFLHDHGYSLNNISWMAAPIVEVPVQVHEYATNGEGEELHAMRSASVEKFHPYEDVEDVKRHEQKELAAALRCHGEKIDNGYEWHFEDECHIVAAYLYDEPCDVIILAARVNDSGDITMIGDDKNDRGNEHEIPAGDIFAGQLSYITSEIGE